MFCLGKDIRHITGILKKKYDTSDPFEIAHQMKVEYIIGPMGSYSGCYMYLKRHRCIFLNENLTEHELRFVMSHELGHAILHKDQNCYFIRHKTLLSCEKIEIEANRFALELLIDDSVLEENRHLTIEQLSRLLGYREELLKLRLPMES